MLNYITHSVKLVAFALVSLLMVACGSNPSRTHDGLSMPLKNLESILKQADQAEPSRKNPLLIQASGILLADNRPNKALELLVHIDTRYLNNQQKDSYHLFYGQALLADDSETPAHKQKEKNQASLNQLLSINKPSAHSIEWQIRYFQVLSDSYYANNNYLESAKQRIGINDLIDQQELLEQNNEKIWLAINQMSVEFLEQIISDFNSQRVNGWLEIVYINKKWGNQPDLLVKKMAQWKLRYPLHPATQAQPKSLQRVAIIETFQAKNIAVLLPLSGRFARSGKMVHDGLLAAHYAQKTQLDSPTVRFYDTNKLVSGMASYQKAVEDGADFIIGPLDKQAIDEILLQDTLSAPTLFLNTATTDFSRHKTAFQFVLSAEDEAIQAAHRAWENGYRKGIAFVPDTQRGERATQAFKDYFEQLGGELVDTQKYSDIKELKSNVQALLHVDNSIKRKTRLEQTLGRNIEFEMRRRKDADFIFMLSKPTEARRIKPFINFYFALDLPVISTSRIYSGRPKPQLDNELNGIEFSDIPLYVSQQADIEETRSFINQIDSDILKDNNGRLFSLGFDAYQILSQLPKLQAFPDYRWYGLSGEIGVDEDGLVHRFLTWAKFNQGIPKSTKERIPPVINNKHLTNENNEQASLILNNSPAETN